MPDTITTAVPQQAPPANAIQHPAKVYLLSRRLPDIVHLVQYDQTLPVLAVELYEGDAPYTVPDGAAVNIRMAKPVPSNKKVYNPAYGISEDRHTVYIAVTPQMTVVAGCTNPVIEVVVDGGIACTGTLRLEIDPNPVQESDIIDTDEYKTLEEILAEAQAAAQIVEDNEQALQDVHNNLLAIQNAAANAQAAADSAQDAEDAADRAAIESQKALGFRSYFGGQVVPDSDGDLDPSRPMSTPTAASVTIKARGDRIAGLTMAGKTTQAGTGDPSPDNVRMISGVGMYDKMIVLDGSEDEGWFNTERSGFAVRQDMFVNEPLESPGKSKTNSYPFGGVNWVSIQNGQYGISQTEDYSFIFLKDDRFTLNLEGFKAHLSKSPLILWYRSVDFYKSKGPFYTVVELSQDPYRAVGFELNAPLFDGDSLEIGGPSGFDQMVVLDGSNDEDLDIKSGSDGHAGYAICNNVLDPFQSIPIVICSSYLKKIDTVVHSSDFGFAISPSIQSIYFRISGVPATVTDYRAYLSAHPLIIFYKSVNYTSENDIAVALEKRVNGYAVWDGEEDGWEARSDGYGRLTIPDAKADTRDSEDISSQFTFTPLGALPSKESGFTYSAKLYPQIVLKNGTDFNSVSNVKTFFQNQYSAGTPVQVVYELATPVSYARPVPTMIAQPGEDGTFTVTGENSLSVLLKPFQDGGDAATIEGHTWADIQKLISDAVTSAIALSK